MNAGMCQGLCLLLGAATQDRKVEDRTEGFRETR